MVVLFAGLYMLMYRFRVRISDVFVHNFHNLSIRARTNNIANCERQSQNDIPHGSHTQIYNQDLLSHYCFLSFLVIIDLSLYVADRYYE